MSSSSARRRRVPERSKQIPSCPCATEFGDGFLRRIEFALLLVVVEDAHRCVEILGICLLRCLRFIQELSQAWRLRQQIEIALDQLRCPQRLERFS